jgi:hypothetical protein
MEWRERLAELNPHIARRWPRRDGPVGGALETLAATLHVVSALERGIRTVVDSHEQAMPDVLRIARDLMGLDLRALSLPEAFTHISVRTGVSTPRTTRRS